MTNGKTVESVAFAFSSVAADEESDGNGIMPGRAMAFYIMDNVIVGYEFNSTYKHDSSNFDESKVPQIKKLTTTLNEVIGLLGKPSEYYIYPLVKNNDEKAIAYIYCGLMNPKFYLNEEKMFGLNIIRGESTYDLFIKRLLITYDSNSIVIDVEYKSSLTPSK